MHGPGHSPRHMLGATSSGSLFNTPSFTQAPKARAGPRDNSRARMTCDELARPLPNVLGPCCYGSQGTLGRPTTLQPPHVVDANARRPRHLQHLVEKGRANGGSASSPPPPPYRSARSWHDGLWNRSFAASLLFCDSVQLSAASHLNRRVAAGLPKPPRLKRLRSTCDFTSSELIMRAKLVLRPLLRLLGEEVDIRRTPHSRPPSPQVEAATGQRG